MVGTRSILQAGFQALQNGNPLQAIESCRRVLQSDRSNRQAHFLFGLAASEMQDWKHAILGFGSVTKLDPKHSAAWAHLARAYLRVGNFVRADQSITRAESCVDGNPDLHDLIGATHASLGNLGDAKHWQQRAYDAHPENKFFAVNLASTLTYLGELDAAEVVLRDTITRDDATPQAHWLLSTLRRAESEETAERLMAHAKRVGPGLPGAFYAYAAGKEFEDLEQWDRAFDAFQFGAMAKRSTFTFDEAAERTLYDSLKSTFTSDWMAGPGRGHDDPAPIFIVGQPRTGTTLVERIITSHSEIESAGELQQFGLAVRRLARSRDAARLSGDVARAAAAIDPHALGTAYLESIKSVRPASPYFVDKLPPNFLYAPLIARALPRAKIIHVTRDPMDSCFSSFKQLFAETYLHSYDLSEMGRHFNRYRGLMAHWRDIMPNRILDVSYEDTVTDLETVARRLISFIGVEWDPRCLIFHTQPGAVATASAVQVREGAHTRSMGRWRRYERHLGVLETTLNDRLT